MVDDKEPSVWDNLRSSITSWLPGTSFFESKDAISPETPKTPEEAENDDILSDEEIEDSAMAQFLNVLIERRKNREAKKTNYYNNIILFNTKEPSKLKNSVLSFNPKSIEPLFSTTNLQLSNLVPVIEILKIWKKTGSDEELEVPLHFPDYTKQEDLENMFLTRTGRGSGIGIKSFEWNSMAQNVANIAQFDASLHLFLQDASELTKIRNYVETGGRIYSVSIKDLLYPSSSGADFDDESPLHNFEYDPKKFLLKIRIGWQTKRKFDDEESNIDPKLLSSLTSEYYLTIFKHDINFNPDGSLELKIKFLAMAEALLDDFSRSDILFGDYLSEKEEQNKETLLTQKREKIQQKIKATTDSEKENIQKQIDEIDKQLDKIKIIEKRSKRRIYKDFLAWLNIEKRIDYLKIPADEKEQLKIIHTFDKKVTDAENIKTIISKLQAGQEAISSVDQPTLEYVKGITQAAISPETEEAADNYKADVNNIVEEYKKSLREKYKEEGKNDIIVPFFYLGDLFEYFYGRFIETRLPKSQLKNKNIPQKDLRLVLGSFSYSDFGNPKVSFQNGGFMYKTRAIKASGNSKKKEKILVLSGDKKTANLAHIPISIKSFLNFFNSKIIDSNLEKYSANRFTRDVMYNLVQANVSNKITRSVPNLRISVLMNSDMIDDLSQLSNNETVLEFLQKTHDQRKNYIVDFDVGDVTSQNYPNPFVHLKTRKAQNSLSKPQSNIIQKNKGYLFLFSSFEYDDDLNRSVKKDMQNNILHFFVGEEKGFIKNISFSREDNPRLDAHNIQVANQGSDSGVLRAVYNATIEMYGNTIFTPGMILFLLPTFPGMRVGDPTLLNIGLGGYYMVLKVNNRIEGGLYTTTLETKWQSFGTNPEGIEKKDFSAISELDLRANGISSFSFK